VETPLHRFAVPLLVPASISVSLRFRPSACFGSLSAAVLGFAALRFGDAAGFEPAWFGDKLDSFGWPRGR